MKPPTCRGCGTTEKVASYGLCPDCLHEVNARECAAQGIPEKIESPRFYDTVARILLATAPQEPVPVAPQEPAA